MWQIEGHWSLKPPQKHHPLFLPTSLKLSKAPFLGNSPHILVFREHQPKNWIFQWTAMILKFLTDLLKVNKFLVKISQCKLLIMTEKNIVVYKIFLLWNISDLGYFSCKNCNPLEKSLLLLGSYPSLKIEILPSPLFVKIWLKGTHYGGIFVFVCFVT